MSLITPPQLGSALNELTTEDLRLAVRKIAREYGRQVILYDFDQKFGANSDLDTGGFFSVVENGADVVSVRAADDIMNVVSTSNSDTGTLEVFGIGRDGNGDYVARSEIISITGQTPVTLANAYAFIDRAVYNRTAAPDNLQGNLQIYSAAGATVTAGLVSPASNVDMLLRGDTDPLIQFPQNQSKKCALVTTKDEFLLLKSFDASVRKKTGAKVDFQLCVQEKGGALRQVQTLEASSGSAENETFLPGFLVPPQSLVQVLASTDTNATAVNAAFGAFTFLDPISRGDF